MARSALFRKVSVLIRRGANCDPEACPTVTSWRRCYTLTNNLEIWSANAIDEPGWGRNLQSAIASPPSLACGRSLKNGAEFGATDFRSRAPME